MLYEAKGKVKEVLPTETFNSGFQKRGLVLEIGEKYKEYPMFEFIKDKVGLLDGLRPGMSVSVSFDIGGRAWAGPKGTKYFVSLRGVIVKAEGGSGRATPPPAEPPSDLGDYEGADDMPF